MNSSPLYDLANQGKYQPLEHSEPEPEEGRYWCVDGLKGRSRAFALASGWT